MDSYYEIRQAQVDAAMEDWELEEELRAKDREEWSGTWDERMTQVEEALDRLEARLDQLQGRKGE